jgi:hypothetical protein
VQQQRHEEFLATFLRANGRRTCVVVGDNVRGREGGVGRIAKGGRVRKTCLLYIRR